jgi:CHAT domain-containing protein/lipopolysaccharide biosynthesis regulator YciM
MRSPFISSGLTIALLLGGAVVQLPVAQVAVTQTVDARKAEADRLLQQGIQQYRVNLLETSVQSFQQALKIYREIKDQRGEGGALWHLGTAYQSLRDYAKAIEYQEQHLAIAREVKDRRGEVSSLGQMGIAYRSLEKYPKAIEYFEQGLAIAREIKDRRGEGISLGHLGIAYQFLGNYAKAIEYFEKSLAIAREIKDRRNEGSVLGNLGIAYQSLGNHAKAIEYQEQHLAIAREVKDRQDEGNALAHLGIAYQSLGNHAKAIEYFEKSLAIAREIKDRRGEGETLFHLGNAYQSLGEHAKAIEYFEQVLAIAREIKDRRGEGETLFHLGNAYQSLGEHAKAIEYFEQVLAIAREIKDRRGEGSVLGNLGNVYYSFENYAKAIEYYEQSLVIAREIKDRESEYQVLNYLGITFAKQSLELAIVFYKQSVSVAESIHQDNRKLPRDLQSSYTKTVAVTYRILADLLLSQGRIGEAQQVLELLKIQEINDITEGTRSPSTLTQVALTQIEQEIIKKHNSLIAFGQQRDTCKQTNCPKLEEYNQTYANLTDAYDKFIETLKTQIAQERDKAIAASTDDFAGGARKIVDNQPKTVLIYPLILKDKTRILWASKGGVLSQAECPLGEAQLSKLTEQFRSALQTSDDLNPVQTIGKQLHQCLLPQKLRDELTRNNIENLVFVPDRITNYIPMAALHDGQQYLIEKYSISNILSVSLTDTQDKLPDRPSVLGFGLSEAVSLTDPPRNFSELPYVPYELDNIIQTNPNTDPRGVLSGSAWLDRDFDRKTLETKLSQQKPNILHIATHGEFIPTDPRTSYLVLGDHTPYSISKIQYLEDLQNVHLVVLSACETALGGSDRNGLEVAGIASYFLTSNAKAKAVLASLWKVNDPATSLLMSEFYTTLHPSQPNPKKLSKAQALRQVQLKFINSNLTLQDAANRAGARRYEPNKKRPQNLSHPYYWAPFILIGNNL